MNVEPVDLVILVLRVLLVACLYGFLILVVRLASHSLRAAATAAPGAAVPIESRRPAVRSATSLRLVVVEPGGSDLRAGQAFEIGQAAVLGRARGADVVLSDAAVSSEHARVQRTGRGWVVTDLGSTNGTRLNGAAVPTNGQVAITAGDVLALGPIHLQVAPR